MCANHESLAATKNRLRAAVRASRKGLSAQFRQAASHGIEQQLARVFAELQPGGVGCEGRDAGEPVSVLGYLPMDSEPNPVPFLNHCARSGFSVAVPAVAKQNRLDWLNYDPAASLVPSSVAGIVEPDPQQSAAFSISQLRRASLMIIPALSVDLSGTRLGQGGGYFDRFLAELDNSAGPKPVLAALVFAQEIHPTNSLPRLEHDQPVQLIISQQDHIWV